MKGPMEVSANEMKTETHPHDQVIKTKKGGLRTMPFIIANETIEKMAGVGLHANMTVYLISEYHMSNATGANVLFLWNSISHFMPIFGAFLADSYLGRFSVIGLGILISLIGMMMLWLTSIVESARPAYCNVAIQSIDSCSSPKPSQLALLFASFGLMAIGAGGIRPCSLAFGADQLYNPLNPKNQRTMQTFFSWYYASVGISIMIAVLVIVYIQEKAGWIVGFGVPVGLMLLSALFYIMGSPLYVKLKADKSLFTGFTQVVAVAWKNKNLQLPAINSDRWLYHKGSKLIAPTENLRSLNKACMIVNPEKELNNESSNVCTVRQVEELKSLIKVLPIWSTGIILATVISQHSFPLLQARTLDRKIFGNITIPAASFSAFGILTLTIWVLIYDRILVPIFAKFTNQPRGLTTIQRMGIGLLVSCIATAVASAVEWKRRSLAFQQGFADNPRGVMMMSAMWLVPQHCLAGLAEALNAIGQIEFYYSQFPKSMASIAVALLALGFAVGNLVAALIVWIVNDLSKMGGNYSWVSNNLNRGHYDYYYMLLCILSLVNFVYFLLCSWAYGCCDSTDMWDESEDVIEEDKLVSFP